MYYPEEIVEEVRSRTDIVELIGSCVHLTKKGSNYFGLCPFHNEKTPSFSVSGSRQMYHCFGCGAGGNAITFLMNYENLTFPEALKSLADRAGIRLPEEEQSAEAKRAADERSRLLLVNKEAAEFYYRELRSPVGERGLQYFRNRGLSPGIMRSFGLGFAAGSGRLWRHLKEKGFSDEEIVRGGLAHVNEKRGLSDRFWNRVIFPIMDQNNRVIGFGGRVMGDGEPKYLNSPETPIFDKGRQLYGLNAAKKSRSPYLIACEGYMDVISMHQAGFTEAVASLGTAFTENHARVLRRYTEDVRLTYDSDAAGTRAALRAIPILAGAGITARIVHLEPCKDPDEFIRRMGKEAFRERVEKAENSLLFEIHILEKEFDLRDPEGRTRFERAMAGRLAAIPEELERRNYTLSLAAEYMIPAETLIRAVEERRLSGSGDRSGARPLLIVTEKRKEKTEKAKEGALMAERLLLTCLSNSPEIYQAVKPYLRAEDFTEGIPRTAAGILFQQLEEGTPAPAAVISRFEDPEEQRAAAELFSTELEETLSREEREKALTELVVKIKRGSLRRMADQGGAEDPIGLMVAEKSIMEKLQKIRIRL